MTYLRINISIYSFTFPWVCQWVVLTNSATNLPSPGQIKRRKICSTSGRRGTSGSQRGLTILVHLGLITLGCMRYKVI